MKGWKGKGKKNSKQIKEDHKVSGYIYFWNYSLRHKINLKNRAGCMRGGAKKLSELERCECRLHNSVSDLTWTRSQWEWGKMLKVEKRSHLGEVRGSGVIYFFFPTTSKSTHILVPSQTQVPFPPLRELIRVCKLRQNHSVFQYKSETLNHTPYHCLLTERWGARSKSVLALLLVPW